MTSSSPDRSPLSGLHRRTQAKRRARQHSRRSAALLGVGTEQQAWEAEDLAVRYPVGHFGPAQGLSIAQAWEANRLLARANQLRPIRGRHAALRYRLRLGGIVSAILGGRVGSRAFGKRLHGYRGGNIMGSHGAHILAANRRRILTARQARRTGARQALCLPSDLDRLQEQLDALNRQLSDLYRQRGELGNLLDW